MLSSQGDPKSDYPKFQSGWLELDYFRRPRVLRGRRKWVTAAVAACTGLAAGLTLLPRNHVLHEAGPLSTAHAIYNADCGTCHVQKFAPLVRLAIGHESFPSVRDQDCRVCHSM